MNPPDRQKVTTWPPLNMIVEFVDTIPSKDGSYVAASILTCRINYGSVRVGDSVFIPSRPDLLLQVIGIEPLQTPNQPHYSTALLFNGVDLSSIRVGEIVVSALR